MAFEYRVCCSVNMVGGDWLNEDWEAWEGDKNMSADEIKDEIENKTWEGGKPGRVTRALDEALEVCGFDYWVEVREAAADV